MCRSTVTPTTPARSRVNQRLAAERASAVLSYLATPALHPHVSPRRRYTYGRLCGFNDTPEGRAQNRRVEIYISANPQMIEQANAGTLR